MALFDSEGVGRDLAEKMKPKKKLSTEEGFGINMSMVAGRRPSHLATSLLVYA